MPFREDIEKINEYDKAMCDCHSSIFHIDATTFSLYFCMIATKGVKLASSVMETAASRLDKRDEISSCTTKQILRPTMAAAWIHTMLYISTVVGRHEMVLGYVPGTEVRRRASDDGEPGALGRSGSV
ncbi:hypothetical protein PAHAL_7G310600 [Panicum hallii]|uniref:Uncharacterized protein n=1 Tax=Panicum hallii TaxID=206008 RepID=A0A2T8IE32_9POAL|nr:hypothetical protein PAHAL_7G310600 [Panicum hallii]